IRQVAEAKADFTIGGTEYAVKWARENIDQLIILFPVDDPVEVGWAVARNAPGLAKELQRFFEESKRVDSPLNANWRQHYRVSLMEYGLFEVCFAEERFDFRRAIYWAGSIGAAVLLLLAVMLFWNRRLKREVALRESVEVAL